ncbi:hypothetical protein PNK_p0027 (plasmid) [Candidatus Protochlamydia naegleriophila]|uniref:Uncharacterized protein n=1 Tax=Candidatus Protochlamydia naegleriophila TaxID=389348 RepID=A0A0U5EV79_9BACT|nr:hypothetical protein [Candidatus Protochlamydia naegleriophila]CUI18081.1 hypothetical protein PNK_p0027 [Candidatus Protochlamydia naegleriophila]
MTIVNQQIEHFRQFLIAAWPSLDNLMENHDWDDDGDFIDKWLQVNWEFLVERELLGPNNYLNSYGFFKALRVTNPDARANYQIICKPKNNLILIDNKTKIPISKEHELIFKIFLSQYETTYGLYPPFDYACLKSIGNKEHFYVSIQDIEFNLEKTN